MELIYGIHFGPIHKKCLVNLVNENKLSNGSGRKFDQVEFLHGRYPPETAHFVLQ